MVIKQDSDKNSHENSNEPAERGSYSSSASSVSQHSDNPEEADQLLQAPIQEEEKEESDASPIGAVVVGAQAV